MVARYVPFDLFPTRSNLYAYLFALVNSLSAIFTNYFALLATCDPREKSARTFPCTLKSIKADRGPRMNSERERVSVALCSSIYLPRITHTRELREYTLPGYANTRRRAQETREHTGNWRFRTMRRRKNCGGFTRL